MKEARMTGRGKGRPRTSLLFGLVMVVRHNSALDIRGSSFISFGILLPHGLSELSHKNLVATTQKLV
jgi:hypothetical protein